VQLDDHLREGVVDHLSEEMGEEINVNPREEVVVVGQVLQVRVQLDVQLGEVVGKKLEEEMGEEKMRKKIGWLAKISYISCIVLIYNGED
jgi:hypothetical protein